MSAQESARESARESTRGRGSVRSRWLVGLACSAALVAAAQPVVATADPPAPSSGLPARAVAQIEALSRAKAARTPAQDKVDSPLLTAAQLAEGRALPAGVRVRRAVSTDRAGRTQVEIRGTVTTSLLRRVRAAGGVVGYRSARSGLVRADLPLTAVGTLAALPQVERMRSVGAGAITATLHDPAAPPHAVGKRARAAQLRRELADAVDRRRSAAPGAAAGGLRTGSVTSEGDRAHGADMARARRHLSGIGITVGVLSDGVDSLRRLGGLRRPAARRRRAPRHRRAPATRARRCWRSSTTSRPKARLAFATAFDGAGELRRQHPCPARRRRRRHRRRRPLLRRVAVPGRPGRAGGPRRHPRRRAVLQLRRQRGQRRPTAPRATTRATSASSGSTIGKFAGDRPRLRPGTGRPARPTRPRRSRSVRPGAPAVGRPARRTPPTTTTSTRSTPAGNVVGVLQRRAGRRRRPLRGLLPARRSGSPLQLAVVQVHRRRPLLPAHGASAAASPTPATSRPT